MTETTKTRRASSKIVVFSYTDEQKEWAAEAALQAAGVNYRKSFGFSRSQIVVSNRFEKAIARRALAARKLVKLTAKDREEIAEGLEFIECSSDEFLAECLLKGAIGHEELEGYAPSRVGNIERIVNMMRLEPELAATPAEAIAAAPELTAEERADLDAANAQAERMAETMTKEELEAARDHLAEEVGRGLGQAIKETKSSLSFEAIHGRLTQVMTAEALDHLYMYELPQAAFIGSITTEEHVKLLDLCYETLRAIRNLEGQERARKAAEAAKEAEELAKTFPKLYDSIDLDDAAKGALKVVDRVGGDAYQAGLVTAAKALVDARRSHDAAAIATAQAFYEGASRVGMDTLRAIHNADVLQAVREIERAHREEAANHA